MTLPLLLLGLYLGLLIVAITIASWAGHVTPAPDEARRVTDAAERAGLSHLAIPGRLALAASLVFACGMGAYAIAQHESLAWMTLAPLFAPLLVGAALFYSGRKLLRASGQLLGAPSADARLGLTSKTAVGAVLCCDTTVALVLLGIYSLAARDLGPEKARFLVFVAGSSIALSAIVFARAAASAHYSVARGTGVGAVAPHAGSLALLVSTSFHAPVLRLLSLVLVSVLGHCTLLSMSGSLDAAGSVAGESGATLALWLYPHLLRVLGLFGVLFAGMVARTAEHESDSAGWIRGAIVYLVLMIAGAWSLSSELPVGWSGTVPAGLSFLYVALGLSVWVGGNGGGGGLEKAAADSWGQKATRKLVGSVLFWGLLLILLLATVLSTREPVLPPGALLNLILAGTLAVVPLSVVWLLARDLAGNSPQTSELAFAGAPVRSTSSGTPSSRLLAVLPHLCLVVALCALSNAVPQTSEGVSGLLVLIFGIGAASGALVLAALVGFLEKASRKTVTAISALVKRTPSGDSNVNFESVIVLCRDAIGESDIYWLLLALAPSALCLSALPFLPDPFFRAIALGLALGTILLGMGLELLFNTDKSGSRRTLANLSFIACLAQTLWLLTAGGIPS